MKERSGEAAPSSVPLMLHSWLTNDERRLLVALHAISPDAYLTKLRLIERDRLWCRVHGRLDFPVCASCAAAPQKPKNEASAP